MSAITGIYYLDDRPVTRHEITGMVESMPHRGPDGSDVWADGSVGLGHCMLHTTPESLQEKLPVTALEGDIVLTADARIDNRQELLTKLNLKDKLNVIPDSTLILWSYMKWGEQCVDHLIGDFAFAIWDNRKKQIFLARDHFGIKQLYYFLNDKMLVFGTEIKAILAHPDISERLNEPVIGVYLANEIDPVETIFQGIVRLLPGHAMSVSPDNVKSWKYWKLEPSNVNQNLSDDEYTERFLELFTEAVRCRTRSAFPVGSELSGGLDSSFVTAVTRDLFREEGRQPLHTISTVYDEVTECDERKYIRRVIEDGDLIPHYCIVDKHDVFDVLKDIYKYLDDGRVGGNHYLNWLSAREAKKAGARILLTGQDGDTTVGHGYQIFDVLARTLQWKRFAYEAEKVVSNINNENTNLSVQEHWNSPIDVLNTYGSIHIKNWLRTGNYLKLALSTYLINKYFPVDTKTLIKGILQNVQIPSYLNIRNDHINNNLGTIPEFINEQFSKKIGLKERLLLLNKYKVMSKTVRDTQKSNIESPYLYLSMELVESYSSAFGVECRHPFMDKRLIEFSLGIPIEQSFNNGWSRIIMRRAMDDIVDKKIQWRSNKASLSAQRRFLYFKKSFEILKNLLKESGKFSDYIDINILNNLITNKDRLTYNEFSSVVNVAHLNLWFKLRYGL